MKTESRVLSLRVNFGRCLSSDGRWHEAEAIFSQILVVAKRTHRTDGADILTATASAWLASTYREQGWWAKAEQLQVQLMETSKTKLGADYPRTLSSMHNLAYILKDLERDDEAVQLMGDCVKRMTCVLGIEHPSWILSYSTLNKWQVGNMLRLAHNSIAKGSAGTIICCPSINSTH